MDAIVQIEEVEERESQILQIMPALPGWEAIWSTVDEPAEGQPGYITEAVVCWALVEAPDGHTFVTAMAPDLESSELKLIIETPYFLGYASPTYSPNWIQSASNRRTRISSDQG
ncbi:MAG: hypothetical protein H0U76_17130 [Ktedonobacteraceae bacterium]|nr:hypothetical protein [Ktedonobacteraceae bacterium]